MKTKQLFISLTLGLGLALTLLWLLGGLSKVVFAQAGSGIIRVALPPTGNDAPNCGGEANPCCTAQYGVDQAQAGDEILIASGIYTGVSARAGVTQVVYISKSVTIRGGYTTTDWTMSDPENNPTTLDAQEQGRVLYITGDISPTIEGLRITGGNAGGLGGYTRGWTIYDAGGGVYVITATASFSNNQVFENAADDGGGLFLRSSHTMLHNNVICSNTALFWGGGVLLEFSDAAFSGNTITANTAPSGGGGLLKFSNTTLSGNTVAANSAYQGGGLLMGYSDTTLSNNTISSNTAISEGGGIAMYRGNAALGGNAIISNSAGDEGGGLYLSGSGASLSGDIVSSNSAGASGGGLFLHCSDATLTNTLIVENQANTAGSGLYVWWCSSLRALHSTIARNNGGDSSGIHVTNYLDRFSTVALTNTILVSHTVGITVTASNTATLEATLWGTDTWANTTDWGGTGTIITGARNYWGDTAFVDPGAGDYHIGLTSTAIDKGVDAGVDDDIDGDPRPQGSGYDIGADESGYKIYLPVMLRQWP